MQCACVRACVRACVHFAPVVAKVATNAKRCTSWSHLFPVPEDGLIHELLQWDH